MHSVELTTTQNSQEQNVKDVNKNIKRPNN